MALRARLPRTVAGPSGSVQPVSLSMSSFRSARWELQLRFKSSTACCIISSARSSRFRWSFPSRGSFLVLATSGSRLPSRARAPVPAGVRAAASSSLRCSGGIDLSARSHCHLPYGGDSQPAHGDPSSFHGTSLQASLFRRSCPKVRQHIRPDTGPSAVSSIPRAHDQRGTGASAAATGPVYRSELYSITSDSTEQGGPDSAGAN